jgi:ankyrin repeat protein
MNSRDTLNRQVLGMLLQGDKMAIMRLLQDGALQADQWFTDDATGQEFTLLPGAIERGWTDVAIYLIGQGVDVNRFSHGQTPLMDACAFRNHELIEALLAAGADVNLRAAKDEEGGRETALMIAAEKRDLWAVRRLLRAGANVKIEAPRKRTAVYFAVCHKASEATSEVVRELVSAGCPLLGNELHYPVYTRDVGTTKLLLELGCPPNTQLGHSEYDGPKKGDTPLTAAVGGNPIDLLECLGLKQERTVEKRQEITRMLLASGADPNLPNTKGWTPLMLTVRQKEFELAEILVDAGADPKYVPSRSKNESPVALATKNKMDDFVHLFQRSARKSPD